MVLPKRNSILSGFNRFPPYDVWTCFDDGVMMENLVWVLVPTGPYFYALVGFPFPHYIGFFLQKTGCLIISLLLGIFFLMLLNKTNNLLWIATLWLWFDKNDYCVDTQTKFNCFNFSEGISIKHLK